MEEKVNEATVEIPTATENLPSEEDTTPNTGNDFVEVKFNKELKKLTHDEAVVLAQKGMKFDMLENELGLLKSLSKSAGMSIYDYLNSLKSAETEKRLSELTAKCSGDSELAKRLMTAEGEAPTDKLSALRAEFPEIKEEDIPEEVKTAAEIKGTGLLVEYLLYNHRQSKAQKAELERRKEAEDASLGSLSSGDNRNAVDAEFLKGIWD